MISDSPTQRLAIVLLFAVALGIRIGAALWLEQRTRAQGREHEFADSELYWLLAMKLASGDPYDDGKRQVLRTPGYPAFLAANIELFGPSITAARHMQAAVGAASCVLVFFLVRMLLDSRTAWWAAGVAAIYPYAVFFSAVLLSEALFTALLLTQLILLAALGQALATGTRASRAIVLAVSVGAVAAAATLVKPSWILSILLVPIPLFLWSQAQTGDSRGRHRSLAMQALAVFAVLAAFVVGMTPWWVRNARITAQFVPTTLFVGASLYDGLNEHADGSSRMEFMDRPDRFGLSRLDTMTEWEQDAYLRGEAIEFARSNPWRALELAAIKIIRFWNPLPNAAEWSSAPLRFVSLVSAGPALVLAVIGAWRLRGRPMTVVLLAAPVVYFCLVHTVFVSSVRYREAAMLPVLGLAAHAFVSLVHGASNRDETTKTAP